LRWRQQFRRRAIGGRSSIDNDGDPAADNEVHGHDTYNKRECRGRVRGVGTSARGSAPRGPSEPGERSTVSYRVTPGDNLWSIAKQHLVVSRERFREEFSNREVAAYWPA
jgi:LysM repeat protein